MLGGAGELSSCSNLRARLILIKGPFGEVWLSVMKNTTETQYRILVCLGEGHSEPPKSESYSLYYP